MDKVDKVDKEDVGGELERKELIKERMSQMMFAILTLSNATPVPGFR